MSCDQEYGVYSDDVSCHVALQGSGHGEFCTGVAGEVQNCGSSNECEGEAKVDCQWSEWNSWLSCNVTCGEFEYSRSGSRGDTGQEHARSQEDKCSEMVKTRRHHHSLSTSGGDWYRMLTLPDWTKNRKMGTDAYTKMGSEYEADPACEGHDIPFWQR